MALIKQKPAHLQEQNESEQQASGNETVVARYIDMLRSPVANERRLAARELDVYPEACPALIEALVVETVIPVRSAILSTLMLISDAESIRALLELLGSENINLRNEVFEVLKSRPEQSIPLSEMLLRDPDPDIRIYAVNLLEAMRDQSLEAKLIEVIETDPHVNVCATAINLLGEVGTKASLAALKKLKLRFANEPYIGFVADVTIGRINEYSNKND